MRGIQGLRPQKPAPSQACPTSLPQVPHWAEGATKDQEKPSWRGPREAYLTASLKPLPSFTPPVRDASTAYIVVGPRVRGKFDVKRAEELGLFGPLRGRVARGETVTFTVDDGTGVKVQRTVRPEDCLGEPESQKVRPPILSPRYCTKQLLQGCYNPGCTNTRSYRVLDFRILHRCLFTLQDKSACTQEGLRRSRDLPSPWFQRIGG
jgi:hypothetical protein